MNSDKICHFLDLGWNNGALYLLVSLLGDSHDKNSLFGGNPTGYTDVYNNFFKTEQNWCSCVPEMMELEREQGGVVIEVGY